jgi:hypothetical protein
MNIFSKREHVDFECLIYALVCPFSKDIKYIGKTKLKLKRRLSMHIRQNSMCKKSIWIKNLISQNTLPKIIEIEKCNNSNWKQREKYYISIYDNLLNENLGGGGGSNIKNNYVIMYKENLLFRNVGKIKSINYLSLIRKFLKHFNHIYRNPKEINLKEIKIYIETFDNNNLKNCVISSLKDFYKNLINQPNKLNSIKYEYKKMVK